MPKANSPEITPVAELGLTMKSQYKPSTELTAAVFAAKERYAERNPNSARLFEEATGYLPGGNIRTLLYSAPFPLCMKYTDFVGELTAALYDHSHPLTQKSLINTITTVGLNLSATIAQESAHAKLICSRFHLDKVRFCNSGTEANLHALAGARHFTGKRKVIVFTGGYHGA